MSRTEKEDVEQKLTWQKGGRRGIKRLKYLGDDSKYNLFSEEEEQGHQLLQNRCLAPKKKEEKDVSGP